MWETFAMPGDLIVNRIPDQECGLNLGYKLAVGKMMKSGIEKVEEGALIIFALQDAKEWTFPPGLELDFQPGPIGVFQLREGDLRVHIRKLTKESKKGSSGTTIHGE
jgi:hypothetical protein